MEKFKYRNSLLGLNVEEFPLGIDAIGGKCSVKSPFHLVRVRHSASVGKVKRERNAGRIQLP